MMMLMTLTMMLIVAKFYSGLGALKSTNVVLIFQLREFFFQLGINRGVR